MEEVEERRSIHSIRDESANASFFRDFSMDEMSDGEGEESSDESDYEGWDDETTLVAKFQEGYVIRNLLIRRTHPHSL